MTDILAVADEQLMPALVVPHYAPWYVRFGTTAMVLAYGPRSRYADEITTANLWHVLLRPGVEVGRSDLRIDPSGYRADMVMQLAETFYGAPGLTERLRATIPPHNVRRAEADLSAHVMAGELDYAWTYENLAIAHGLRFVKLPPEIDLSAPEFAGQYARASTSVPQPNGQPPLRLRGAPIIFVHTVPDQAPHGALALEVVQYLLSDLGSAVLRRTGFSPLVTPEFVGAPPALLRSVHADGRRAALPNLSLILTGRPAALPRPELHPGRPAG